VIKISWDQGFKRAYRKKVKNDAELTDRFWDAAELFENIFLSFINKEVMNVCHA